MAGYKRQLNEPRDMAALFQDMKSIPYPFVVTVRQGADRTLAQNRLLHRWFTEIAQHYGDRTEAEVKAQCNLQYGRPILMQDNDERGLLIRIRCAEPAEQVEGHPCP